MMQSQKKKEEVSTIFILFFVLGPSAAGVALLPGPRQLRRSQNLVRLPELEQKRLATTTTSTTPTGEGEAARPEESRKDGVHDARGEGAPKLGVS